MSGGEKETFDKELETCTALCRRFVTYGRFELQQCSQTGKCMIVGCNLVSIGKHMPLRHKRGWIKVLYHAISGIGFTFSTFIRTSRFQDSLQILQQARELLYIKRI